MAGKAPDERRSNLGLIAGIALLLGLVVFGVYRWLGDSGSPEDQIRAVLDEMEEGIERRDAGAVIEHVSERYKDKDGLDKRGVRLLLAQLFLRRKGDIHVQRIGSTDVTVKPDRTAEARFHATFREGNDLSALREMGSFDFEVSFERSEDGDWLVTGHRRRPR